MIGSKKSMTYRLSQATIMFFLCFFFFDLYPIQPTNPQPGDSTKTSSLRYPIQKKSPHTVSTDLFNSPMYLNKPSNVQETIVYDPELNQYVFSGKVGKFNISPPLSMSLQEYKEYEKDQFIRNYWNAKSRESYEGEGPAFMQKLRLRSEAVNKVFGTDAINIVPQGSAELIFGYNISRTDNPALPERNRKNGDLIFEEKIQINVNGNIGDKFELGLNYNTEASFDFENKTKLQYAGKEDEIIKKIEGGDITFPLPGTLIPGSQGLFGAKIELQFGKLYMTNVFSQQRSQSSVINVEGGAQLNEFEVNIDEYDANRHFFLSHFFRDNYNEWMRDLPYISSGVRIEQIEVWITNKTSAYDEDNRNILALMDLGEDYGQENEANFSGDEDFIQPSSGSGNPCSNRNNRLYDKIIGNYSGIRQFANIAQVLEPLNTSYDFQGGRDYEKIENARKLSPRDYTINRELGYISLNSALRSDEILAVAYVYTYRGQTFKVGELSTDGITTPQTLVVKLLKGTSLTPKLATWDLMMKNVYSLGAYQLSRDNFLLDIFYKDDQNGTPVNYYKKDTKIELTNMDDKIWLKILNMDNLDSRNEPNPDGIFDYVEGVTMIASNGRVIFPLVEPFGKDLREQFYKTYPNPPPNLVKLANKYVFEELYDSTQTKAKQIAEKNKFVIAGEYQSSSSSEIQLNAFNIPQGSVKVSAGGIQLKENVDYTVDYNLGRVKILNDGLLESGTPIRISLESNTLFNFQTKTMIGTHLDYRFSENFNIGATLMNLTERPLTQKVNMGDEPISNTMWGLNTSYQTQSQLLTTLIDKLPLIETKEVSSIALDAEFAHLIPGQSKLAGKNGRAFIDDFEGSETTIELKTIASWVLASTPQGQPNLFPEGNVLNNLNYGKNRAMLAWYFIDPLFIRGGSRKPGHINDDDLSNHYEREIPETEIFENRESGTGFTPYISTLNLAFYPSERGPYNYDLDVTRDGFLRNPQNRWGGIMREIHTSDFETSNVEYIEFWLMDPYLEAEDRDDPSLGGTLYFNLGEISEDILRDSRKTFEHGLPVSDELTLIDTTAWGIVPTSQSIVQAFDNEPSTRPYQDVGLDGLRNEQEQTFFDTAFLEKVEPIISEEAYDKLFADPSSDNFLYYLDGSYDDVQAGISERYKNYNGMENNSPASEQTGSNFTQASTTAPNVEDINRDNTLNETEAYFQYEVPIRPDELNINNPLIKDIVRKNVEFKNGEKSEVIWYQFRIPISEFDRKIGNIEDFKSIRFFRVFLREFTDPVIFRFAELQLVRSDWRKYIGDFSESGIAVTQQIDDGSLELSAINIEENSTRQPVNYILPPGVDRVIDPTQPQTAHLNEQSLVIKITDLRDGDAKAIYKNVQLDLRQYKRLQMYIHGEAQDENTLEDDEITVFIRLGTDYVNNYYEYEIPVKLTPFSYENYYNDENDADRETVWPVENNFNIELDSLVYLKKDRRNAIDKDPINYDITKVFVKYLEGGKKMKIRGNPILSEVRTIMLGVRNPGDADNNTYNDGLSKSAEIWFNELRLTDFKNKGGWAANARVQAKLADLGTLSMAGSTSKPGFGSIEQKVEERSREEIIQYDVSSNIELGKLFPEKTAVSVPLYVGYSRSIINPEYYPEDPDRLLEDVLDDATSKKEQKAIKEISQDNTERKSINLTNVKWNKDLEKIKPLSPRNLSFSVGYSEITNSNYSTLYNNTLKYNAGISYVYSTRIKNIQPLRKSKILRSKHLALIRDFNFTPLPSRVTFNTNIDRFYNEVKMRDIFSFGEIRIDSTINKDFSWNRAYSVNWDLTRSLKFDFSANSTARIGEIAGGYDLFRDNNEQWKDTVWSSILSGGDPLNYRHSLNVSYNVPVNKIPLLGWVNLTARYSATYHWNKGPILKDKTRNIGNDIQNSNTKQINTTFNLKKIYSNIGFVNRIEKKYAGRGRDEKKRTKEVNYTSNRMFLRTGVSRNILHKLGTEDIEVTAMDAEGNPIDVKVEIVNENKIRITADQEYSGVIVDIKGTIEKGENPFIYIADNTVRMLVGLKNVSITYSENEGTSVKGFLPYPDRFGSSSDKSTLNAPGLPFMIGIQDQNFVRYASEHDWLTRDELFASPYLMTSTENLSVRGNFSPFRGFRIDISANRTFSKNMSEYYLPQEDGSYIFNNRVQGGNYSISFISLGSAFGDIPDEKNQYTSKYFERFKKYRSIISRRQAEKKYASNDIGYRRSLQQSSNGYGETSPDVLIPAFLAAYGNINPENVTLEQFPSFLHMLPNWRMTLDGLTNFKFVKKYLKSLTFTHSYKSTYNIGSYTTYLDYEEEFADGFAGYARDLQNNFIPQYVINAVSINEQFGPLAGVDITLNNNLLARFEYKKSRTLALSLSNNQLAESRNKELIVGSGYRFKEVPITLNGKKYKSDLNLRFDFSIRDDMTIIRYLVEEEAPEQASQITQGQNTLTMRTTADYMLTERFNIQLYFDRRMNKPKISRTFLTAETSFGFSLRFTLAQ